MHLWSRDLTEAYSLKPTNRMKLFSEKLFFASFSPFEAVVLTRPVRAGGTNFQTFKNPACSV